VSWLRRASAPLLGCGFLLLASDLFAQGCASCYTSAAAGGPQTAHALRSGILVLLFPPTILFAAIIITLRRWRGSTSRLSDSKRTSESLEINE